MGRRAWFTHAHQRLWPHLLVWAALIFLSFRQQVGQTTFDTKLDLSVDVGSFLERTLTAWNPMSAFGEMQNQAYGYLFPQGAFFLLGDTVGLPEWVVQRLWSALLLVVAYEGARRLFAVIDEPRNRAWLPMMAGLAFALSPRLLGLSGVLTGEIHPTAVLPWVVLPLALALRGVLTPLHGAAWSGFGVLMMGGVNATEVLLALPVAGFVILCAMRDRVGRALAIWWPIAVILATSWWVSGLLTQGRYSPPFLDYIETASTTTGTLGWANVVRGADHWLSFIWVGGQPWWEGSYELATDPWLVGITGLVAAVSLFGLFHHRMPWRLPFALSALTGMILLGMGHADALAGPFSGTFRGLLDGPLSPFRNIHKLDPIVRLPLALGFAHGVGVITHVLATQLERRPPHSSLVPYVRHARPATIVVALLLLLASAQPLISDQLRKPGWDEFPRAWYEAAEYLERNSGQGRTLILPGSGFGQQTWGWTIDEPMQPLAGAPWVSRSQIPLAPGGTIRYLDAIEERIQDGVGSPVLADALARAGIKHVLVRRDLDSWATETPSPVRVDQALSLSPGLKKVASYGTADFGVQPMIDIFEVDRNVPLLEAVDLDSVKTLSGGPEDTITAMEAGLLKPGEVTVNFSEPGWSATPDIVGDGFRRRERQFGRLVDSVSQVMSASEPFRTKRAAHDYPGVSEDDRVVAQYTSLASVTASTSSGYVDMFGAIQPEMGPFAALDGTEETYWRSAPLADPTDQWLEMRFTKPEPLTELRLVAGVDGVSGVPVRRVRVQVGPREFERGVDPATGEVVIPLTGANVDKVRIEVAAVFGDPEMGVVALREVAFKGVEIDRTLLLPDNGATGDTAFVFRARPSRRACVDIGYGPQCDVSSARASEEEFGLNRRFVTETSGKYLLSAEVVVRSTQESALLLNPFPNQLRALASSTVGWDPSVAGQRAVDGDPSTLWVAGRRDTAPSLDLDWGVERTINQLTFDPANISASQPVKAIIEAGDERREVDMTADALGYFKPITASRAKITFPMAAYTPGGDELAPLAIGELNIGGLEEVKAPWSPDQPTGAVCGFGPDVNLDGERYRTKVVGKMGQVVTGTPLQLELCGSDEVDLASGDHRLAVTSTPQYAVTSLTLTPAEERGLVEEEERGREVAILDWSASERTVRVGQGPEGVLRVPENVNIGWVATLDGEELEPLRLDSWQQGFKLPAGEGGVVELKFAPDSTYRIQLVLGAIAALLVFGVAVVLEVVRVPGPRRVASVPVPRWLGRGRRSRYAVGAVAGYVFAGVPLAVGLLLGVALIGRGAARVLLPSAFVVVATTGQAISASNGGGVHVSWTDWVAGAAVGLFLMTLVLPNTGEEER
ncbi:alpha-(1-_3)-arabinofuranosyltransferase domain-containing protein [Nocardioides gilvus]|uniref:alpha-(1->3)-arabinofuranosyltransferase domain-containing protein n=1 Tax=Nocardioides gilvus TaxID=1735589 RepID=UPI0013A574AE|nr:alpha-(1->3)-arabinofuranosyltransferase family protein [Nocardioides gilvus]